MVPRHFWWLCETLDGADTKRGARLSKADREELLDLVEQYNRGDL